ncbi:cytochrome [Salmonella enterica]|nr:cytochrome [Salmonella enterica]EBJ8146852.1 cytochrome [Salmonella enterica]EBL2176402.1 cytochrome [Salmonella enterica]ECE5421652.1 cytochrome [Salmonella enterica]EEK3516956.1 cytochrome [Salmonella enterica]
MNLHEMLAALSPKREAMEIDGFTFYARPMTLKEFNEHLLNANKELRDEISIMRCIVDEDNNPVFTDINQIRQLYTSVRSELIGLVATASLMPEPAKVEEEVK